MEELLTETSGYAPAGLIERLRKTKWRRIPDDEGGKLFPGLALAGRHLVKDGGSEPLSLLVRITDESTGDSIVIGGRTFDFIPREVAKSGSVHLKRYSLAEKSRKNITQYTVRIFSSDKLY